MIELSPERVRELSAQARANVETKANDRDDTRWWHPDHFDQEFARLIIREVAWQGEVKTNFSSTRKAATHNAVEKLFKV